MRQTTRFACGKIRVLVACPTLGVGGAEQWLAALVRHCYGLRFVGCLVESSEYSETSSLLGSVPLWFRDKDPKAADRAARTPADVVLTWAIPELAPQLLTLGIPIVHVSHSSGAEPALSQSHAYYRVRAGETQAHFFAAVCESAVLSFAPEIRQAERITIIHNGSDLERVAPRIGRIPQRMDWQIDEAAKVLLYNGRFSPEKRPETIIEALRYLPEDWAAVMHGWGKMAEGLRESAKHCGRKVVFPHPRVAGLGDLYAAADVVALPSATEAMPLTIIEAAQAGRPVVCSDFATGKELERYGLHTLRGELPIKAETLARLAEFAVERAAADTTTIAATKEAACTMFSAGAQAHRWETYLASCLAQWHLAGIYPQHWSANNATTHRPQGPTTNTPPESLGGY